MDVFTKYEQFSLLALIIEAQFMNFYMKTRKSQKQSFIQEGFFYRFYRYTTHEWFSK